MSKKKQNYGNCRILHPATQLHLQYLAGGARRASHGPDHPRQLAAQQPRLQPPVIICCLARLSNRPIGLPEAQCGEAVGQYLEVAQGAG